MGGAASPRVRSLDPVPRAAPAAGLTRSLPNALTLARLILAPFFALLFLVGSPAAHVASLALYVALALTDLYDGWLARRTGIITSFGKFMDPLADKVLVSLALIVLLARGFPFVPAYLVLLIVGREFLVTGLRSLTGYRGVILVPSVLAKLKTVLQNLFVIAALATIVVREHRGQAAAAGDANAWLLAFLWCVTAITLISGVLYLVGTREIVHRVAR